MNQRGASRHLFDVDDHLKRLSNLGDQLLAFATAFDLVPPGASETGLERTRRVPPGEAAADGGGGCLKPMPLDQPSGVVGARNASSA